VLFCAGISTSLMSGAFDKSNGDQVARGVRGVRIEFLSLKMFKMKTLKVNTMRFA